MADPDVARLCWAMARECRSDDVAIVGVATPLALASVWLARELVAPDLHLVAGGAVDPAIVPIAATMTDAATLNRAADMTLRQAELLPMVEGGVFTIQFVSPAQVSVRGELNTSWRDTADGRRIIGGCLALPDTVIHIGRLVAHRLGGRDGFVVDRVDHVTGARPPAGHAAASLGQGVVCILDERHRVSVPDGRTTTLDDAPAEVHELLDRRIDPDGVLVPRRRAPGTGPGAR